MANTKIRGLTELTTIASGDFLEVVDVSDTTMGVNGTNKQITKANLVTGLTVSNISDLTASATEINYTDGVTSAIQTQLDAKQALDQALTDISGLTPTDSNFIVGNGTNFVAESGSTARTSLGLGTIATQNANNVTISGGSVTGITDLTVADGGTGASTLTANNVILGNGTSAVQFVAPSTSGNVLTSNGTTWTSAAGGAGFSHWLNHVNAEFPDSAFPSIGKTVGSNWVYTTLDFDQSTDEVVYWYVAIPADVTPASANLIIHWTASAGTAAQAVYWACTARSIGNDQVVDATTTPNTSANTANDALLATGDIHRVDMSLTLTDWNAGELIQLKFSRDADNGSDNLAADAKLVGISLEITE